MAEQDPMLHPEKGKAASSQYQRRGFPFYQPKKPSALSQVRRPVNESPLPFPEKEKLRICRTQVFLS